MESPNISVLANLIRNPLAKLDSDSPLATWRVVSAIPGDLFVMHRGQKFYTPTAFGKSVTTPGER